jgi:hypothetical protein
VISVDIRDNRGARLPGPGPPWRVPRHTCAAHGVRAQLRRMDPVHLYRPDTRILTKYHDICAVSRDFHRFSARGIDVTTIGLGELSPAEMFGGRGEELIATIDRAPMIFHVNAKPRTGRRGAAYRRGSAVVPTPCPGGGVRGPRRPHVAEAQHVSSLLTPHPPAKP